MRGNKGKRLELFEAGVWFNLTAGLFAMLSQNETICVYLDERKRAIVFFDGVYVMHFVAAVWQLSTLLREYTYTCCLC